MNKPFRIIVAIGLVVSLFTASLTAAAQENDNDNGTNDDNDIEVGFDHEFEIHGFDFHSPEFYNVWERTDRPVLEGDVARSWLWGPAANTNVFDEPYEEADDGTRQVQYGDKSRMEMPVPGSGAATDDADSPWNITQGLLATELLTGALQLGDDTFEQYEPAEIPVAGDLEDNPGPTYADMAVYLDWESRPTGGVITQAFDATGQVEDDEHFAQYDVTDEYYIEQTDHNIASVFWDFMQSEGLVYDNDELTEGPLFLNEFYAIGYPITEAYWGVFTLRGETQDILIQCFERRCLTYAPDNEPEWQVESGNVGLHYHEWRYNIIGEPIEPDPEPELQLALAQEDDTNEFGTAHELTATLTLDDDPVDIESDDDVTVSITRDGNELDTDSDLITIEVTDNVATIAYPGPGEGTDDVVDTIDVSVSVDGTEVVGEPTLTKTWVAPDPVLSLTLAHVDDETNFFGTDHTITATLAENGDAVNFDDDDEITVTIERDGTDLDPIDGLDVQVANNVATITYDGPAAGTADVVDTINVTVDIDGTNVVGEPTLTKTWVLDPETCDVTVEDDGSIQAAIDAADEDDVICVEPGEYEEQLRIETNGLTLLALEGPGETTIAAAPMPDQGGVVGIVADDVTVTGFTIDNEGDDNGRAVRVSNSTDGVTIQDNVFTNSRRGVQGQWAATSEHGDPITNLTITGNTFDVEFGIAGTEDMDGLVITGNTFNTTEEGVGLGEGVDNWELHTNHFEGLGSHVADHRDEPSEIDLNAIIDANTFEAEVHVVGDAIVDII